ncbi:MAG TPA: hypothetical protein ENJ00_07150 [Phycisphaerales bacterium]|nr:hypothetical protein [Phycisphaerales bacterium]
MKNVTRTGLACVLLIAGAGVPASGQDSAPAEPATAAPTQAELPSAASLFDRHIEAIGGQDAIHAVTSRKMTGRLKVFVEGKEGPVQTAVIRMIAEAPSKLIQEMVVPGQSSTKIYFDGKAGWAVNIETGEATPIEGEQLDQFATTARFYNEADYTESFKSIKTIEKRDLPTGTVYVVQVDYFSGRQAFFLFSEDNGFLVGVLGTRELNPGQRVEFRRFYEEYTDVEGVKYPTRVRESFANLTYEISFTKIEPGAPFPEITRPEGIPDADLSRIYKPTGG